MSGPKRNPDKLNTIGIVVVGVCGAVLVYVTIVALQAFYMNDTSQVDTMADYGGQDISAKSHKADELRNITTPASNAISNQVAPGTPQTYRIDIDTAMKLIVRDAANDPSHLIPALPSSTHPTIEPIFGRPNPLATPAPAAPAAAGSGAAAAGSGAAAPAAGSAAAGTAAAAGSGAGSAAHAAPAAEAGHGH